MAGIIMTILAQIGHLFRQQRLMPTAVGRVTDHTILCNRRMFPDKGAPLVGMALVAQLVGILGLEHMFCLSAVGVMAIGTLDLAFNDGMVRHLVGVGPFIFVAAKAYRGLFHCGAGRMNVMAGGTGYIVLFVGSPISHRDRCADFL